MDGKRISKIFLDVLLYAIIATYLLVLYFVATNTDKVLNVVGQFEVAIYSISIAMILTVLFMSLKLYENQYKGVSIASGVTLVIMMTIFSLSKILQNKVITAIDFVGSGFAGLYVYYLSKKLKE